MRRIDPIKLPDNPTAEDYKDAYKTTTMTHATGDTLEVGSVSIPVFVLLYEAERDGIGRVWFARSMLSGHMAVGSTAERARSGLLKTIRASFDFARRRGQSFEEWYRDLRPAAPEFIARYVTYDG